MADDIEYFIQQQKQKLAAERRSLGQEPDRDDPNTSRRTWDRTPKSNLDEQILQHGRRGPQDRQTEDVEGGTLPLGQYEEKKRRLQEERKRETQEVMDKGKVNGFHVDQNRKENIPPPRPQSPEETGLIGQLGSYDQKRKKLEEERKKEYNKMLSEQELRRTGRHPQPQDNEEVGLPAMNRKMSAEARADFAKRRARNEEYRQFLEQEEQKRRHRYDSHKPADAINRSPPPKERTVTFEDTYDRDLRRDDDYDRQRDRYDDRNEQRKMAERNREYNDFLQQKSERDNRRREDQRIRTRSRSDFLSDDEDAFERGRNKPPRRGWGTPTYEEILEQKRREESRYRRYDDPEYSRTPTGMRLGDDNYRRSAISDGYLNDDRRRGPREPDPSPRRTHPDPEPPTRQGRRGYQPPQEDDSRQAGATLLVGHENSESAKRRKQEEYRKELELQMKGDKEAKQREKEREKANDMRINVSGAQDPEKRPDRLRELPPAEQRGPPRQYQSVPVQPYHPVTEDLSPRSQAFQKYQAQLFSEPSSRPAPSILDRGWGGDLYGRPLEPGLGLLSRQPGDYLGAAGQPQLSPYNSPLDEAYYYYANKNPLDVDSGIGGIAGPSGVGRPSNFPQYPQQTQQQPPQQPQQGYANRDRNPPPQEGGFIIGNDRSKSRADKQSYNEELRLQMEEKQRQKQLAKEEQEKYDLKKQAEIENYDPFGKGGGGAPLRDRQGNLVADLKRMHITNKEGEEDPTRRLVPDRTPAPPPVVNFAADSPYGFHDQGPPGGGVQGNYPGLSPREGHGRGQSDIFGPTDNTPKSQKDLYQEELKKQIEEKRKREEEEKAKIKAEEEKQMRKIEEDRLKIQAEFEAEQKKQREKEEETQRKNEMLKKQAEEKRLEAEARRKELEEKRQQEIRERQEQERLERQRQAMEQRGSSPPVPAIVAARSGSTAQTPARDVRSPPIPALRSNTEDVTPSGRTSPPVPARDTEIRSQSADVLRQLAAMRQQLHSERKKVENALEQQKYEVDVSDPRVAQRQRPPQRDPVDVFDPRRPVSVKRNRTADSVAQGKELNEFNDLKYKKDTESRQKFRSEYPGVPVSDTALEVQQQALLDEQENRLAELRANNSSAKPGPSKQRDLSMIREDSMLDSNTAFIGVDDNGVFPDDLDDLEPARRNESARSRRRQRQQSPRRQPDNLSIGSQLSLDADKITKKNQERLRKLRSIQGDDISMMDPDDVLNNFMARQDHQRPASGNTLQDDSWLRPGTRDSAGTHY